MLKTDLVGRLDVPIVVDMVEVKGNKNNRIKIASIYRITSPTGKIYIGQSIDVEYRFYVGYKVGKPRQQMLIFKSITKHGLYNHVFELIHILDTKELDKDQTISELNKLETLCITEFKSFIDHSKNGLNLSMGGDNKSHSEQSKKKISEANKGKVNSPETREKIRQSKIGSKSSDETNMKNSIRQIGNKNHFYGKKHTEEAKSKMSKWKSDNYKGENHPNYGKHCSDETKEKIRKGNIGKTHTEERKAQQSKKSKGDKNPMLGKTQSDETKAKISDKNKGKKRTLESIEKQRIYQTGRTHSEDTKRRQSEIRKEYWRLKKENNLKNKNNGKN